MLVKTIARTAAAPTIHRASGSRLVTRGSSAGHDRNI